MPALSAAEAREASIGLDADDIEAILDRKIDKAVDACVCTAVTLTDADLGRGSLVWLYVNANGTGSALLDEIVTRYRAAGYTVIVQKAPAIKRDGLDNRKHCLVFSWAEPACQAIAA